MRRVLVLSACIVFLAEPTFGQVIVEPPPNIVEFINCSNYPVLSLQLRIRYRMINVRPGGGEGRWSLYYQPSHTNETNSGNANDRFIAQDVNVDEEYSDMGDWVMRQNWGRNRWHGECVRTAQGYNVVYGVDIYGNLEKLPTEEDPPPCPEEWTPEPEPGECTGSQPAPGGAPPPGEDPTPPYPGCIWYEYTYYNWYYGQWTAIYQWYVCE